jgi:hypothetical protein
MSAGPDGQMNAPAEVIRRFGLVGGLFRRHVLGQVSWEVEKNLIRLAGDRAGVVDRAVAGLRTQAAAWADAERMTLDRLLGQRPAEAPAFHEALGWLEETGLVTGSHGCDAGARTGG